MHISVLKEEVIDFLKPDKGKYFIDATVNGGGHAKAILEYLPSDGMLVGIDRDSALLENVKKKFAGDKRFHPVHANFAHIKEAVTPFKKKFDGVLFDLGMSSFQLTDTGRGFSFQKDEPLDMRYNIHEGFSAENALNSWNEEKLREVLFHYGEERYARRIAKKIVDTRVKKPIHTTFDLVEVITKAIPKRFQSRRIHPATRTFQALRIAVNDELHALEEGLRGACDITKKGGRIVVISFHSLEDRIVKQTFRGWAKEFDVVVRTKKPVTPSKKEIQLNPRARSAKLRAIEK